MKQHWTPEELFEYWTLMPDELELVQKNKTDKNRLSFAILLKFFQLESRFPWDKDKIPNSVIDYVAKRTQIASDLFFHSTWENRTTKYHRKQIRDFLGFRPSTLQDANEIIVWLREEIFPKGYSQEQIENIFYEHLRELKIEPFSSAQIERFIGSARNSFQENLFATINSSLSPGTQNAIDELLSAHKFSSIQKEGNDISEITLNHLKMDPRGCNTDSVFDEIAKLKALSELGIPSDLFQNTSQKILQVYRYRVASESPGQLQARPPEIRYAMLSIYCHIRKQEIIDNLVDLLIRIPHRIASRADKRVINEYVQDFKKVKGKPGILFRLAETAVDHPDGIIKEVLYPVVGEKTLKELVKEFKNTGSYYKEQVQYKMRSSYRNHYRRILAPILNALEFCSNNSEYSPLVEAIQLIKKFAGSKKVYYPEEEAVPVDGVVPGSWRHMILEKESDRERVQRINYEMAALQALRDRLRCKEVWIKGANRYRNPDEDLPSDFDKKRTEYYQLLNQPPDAETFIEQMTKDLRESLDMLDKGLPKNPKVKILKKNNGWISVSPLKAQAKPIYLEDLRRELLVRWPITSLLDVLKETELRLNLSSLFKSTASREHLSYRDIQKRLILGLFGIGTNTGLKRCSAGNTDVTYQDLRYIRRRFITKENLRNALIRLINEIFAIRDPNIWGEATTACASDSKKFGAWDQNLMTEWHIRYRGRGVMIYWHVEKKSLCVYSQLKTCSSSEVANMIEGVLRHCTDMSIEKNYVDSHGQSEVGFAFSYLLGFDLLPRLKRLPYQKLSRPEAGSPQDYPNLQLVLTKPINWKLIREQYDQMIKYTAALRLGTASSESILRRFTRENLKQ